MVASFWFPFKTYQKGGKNHTPTSVHGSGLNNWRFNWHPILARVRYRSGWLPYSHERIDSLTVDASPPHLPPYPPQSPWRTDQTEVSLPLLAGCSSRLLGSVGHQGNRSLA